MLPATTLRPPVRRWMRSFRRWATIPALAALLCGTADAQAPAPAAQSDAAVPAAEGKTIVLFGGTVHTVAGKPIDKGVVLLAKGRIAAVGAAVAQPGDAVRIDCTGKHVYPLLFDASTDLGLEEIAAMRATIDKAEVGRLNPSVEARVAVNPDSELIPVARSSGVGIVLSMPQGALVNGFSSVLQLEGWTPEDLTLKSPAGLHIRWPRQTPQRGPKEEPEVPSKKQIETRDADLRTLEKFFEQAKAYRTAVEGGLAPPRDARFEALLPVLKKQIPVIVTAEEADEIRSAAAFCKKEDLQMILHGGYAADACTELLKADRIPVLLFGVHRLPRSVDDPYDHPFALAGRLHAAGVPFAITSNDGPAHVRNLPYQAGTAIAYGLPEEAALEAVTLAPAKILGVADRVGSLEPGKDATLFIASEPLFSGKAVVLQAWIQGRAVDLDDKQKILWRKYQKKLQERDKFRAPEAKPAAPGR